MAEGLRLRTELDKSFRPLSGEFLTVALLELTPPRRRQRLPLNLGVLLDCSESMSGAKLDRARQACLSLIDALEPEDHIAVVSFNSQTHLLVTGPGRVDATRDSAAAQMARLRAEGVTALERGLDAVYLEVGRLAGPDCLSFVMVMSDGYPTNRDGFLEEDTSPFLRRADREQREAGVSLTTIGLGDAKAYDPVLLRNLADAGNGQFLYCPDPADLPAQFTGEFQRLQRTVLAEVNLTVRHLGGQLRRLWRAAPDKKLFDTPDVVNGTFTVPLGSFQDDLPQAFLLEVVTTAPAGAQPERFRLLEAEAAWIHEGRPRSTQAEVVLEYTDHERALAQRNPEVVHLATECLDALLEGQLEEAVEHGDTARQTAVLARKKQLTRKLGKTVATQVLEEMEAALARGESISRDALARSSQATRPTQRLG